MKRSIFTLIFLFSAVLLFAQEPKSAKQIQHLEKGNLKTTGTIKPESNPTQPENITTNENSDSNIYLRLEYKSEESKNTTTEVQNTEVLPETVVEKDVTPVKTIDEQIKHQEELIKAIDEKVKFAKNNPVEDKRAKESGWYLQMEKNKVTANKKLDELNNSKK